MAAKILQLVGLFVTFTAALVFFIAYNGAEDPGDVAGWLLGSVLAGCGGIGVFIFGRVIAWWGRN